MLLNMNKELIVFTNGVQVRTDKDGNICITDLWASAGKVPTKAPKHWFTQDASAMFIETLEASLKVTSGYLIKSKRGRNGGTYAHKQIALAYAKYLSPELHLAVNQAFFERIEEEKNPELAVDRAVRSWQKQGKDERWISGRLESKAARITFTATLAEHGVKGIGFRDCTNAIYTPLFGGGAEKVRDKKSLPEKSNTREHMTEVELATVKLSELLATENIKAKNLKGNKPCEYECLNTSRIIARAILENKRQLAA